MSLLATYYLGIPAITMEEQDKLTVKVYYSPTNAQVIVLKTILKFTLKSLQYVSVKSLHLQGAHYLCLLKLHFIKIVIYGTSVCDQINGNVAAYTGRVCNEQQCTRYCINVIFKLNRTEIGWTCSCV